MLGKEVPESKCLLEELKGACYNHVCDSAEINMGLKLRHVC